MEIAEEHFGCDDIMDNVPGIEFENEGGDGSQFAHWERRVLGNEIMTATDIVNPAFSKFTFALLKDSGWYDIDYEMAE